MVTIKYAKSDGGRTAAGYADDQDCVIRAVAEHLPGPDRGETYTAVRRVANLLTKELRRNKRLRKPIKSYRDKRVNQVLFERLGFVKVQLPAGPKPTWSEAWEQYGDCIVSTSHHVAAIRGGVLLDTECSLVYTFVDEMGFPSFNERKAASVWRAPARARGLRLLSEALAEPVR